MPKAFLLDIEGTTTPIDFVHKILFPYSRDKIAEYVTENWDSLGPEISQVAAEVYGNLDAASKDDVTRVLISLIDKDRKSTPLKTIQGLIWEQGYANGELVSQVFDDVPAALEGWKRDGKIIAIYSSGSVLAQKLLFHNTEHGDLTPFIDAYFDTHTGPKRDATSYRRIADSMAVEPKSIVFVSDIVEELSAASEAGMETRLSIRAGNAAVAENAFVAINRLDEI